MVGGLTIFDRSFMCTFKVVCSFITKVKKAWEIKQVSAADNILAEHCGCIHFLSQLEDFRATMK